MPSNFESDFSDGALAGLYDRFGVSGSEYSDKTLSAAVTCVARIIRHEARQEMSADMKNSRMVQTAEIRVRQSEVAKPMLNGRFKIDAEVWSIETVPVLRAGQFFCICMRVNTDRRGEMRERVNG